MISSPICGFVFYTAYDKVHDSGYPGGCVRLSAETFEEQELRDILARFVEQAEAGQQNRCNIPIGGTVAYRTDIYRIYAN